ncbi:MAG: hypothetical protein AABY22_06040, partial [Nanoarchaeota archaeon]
MNDNKNYIEFSAGNSEFDFKSALAIRKSERFKEEAKNIGFKIPLNNALITYYTSITYIWEIDFGIVENANQQRVELKASNAFLDS